MQRPATAIVIAMFFLAWTGASAYSESLPAAVDRLEKELAALKQQVEKSNPGAQGPQGSQGQPGPQGAQGPPGPKGDPGTLGLQRIAFSPGQIDLKSTKGFTAVKAVSGEQGGMFEVFNIFGKQIAYLGANKKGRGSLRTYSETGDEQITLGSTDQGSVLFTLRNKGTQVIYIGAATDGSGIVEVNGKRVNDYAEVFELLTRQGVEPGSVMTVAGPAGSIAPSSAPYERRVVGVISGAGGLRSGTVVGTREDGSNDLPLAVSGQVYVRVCGEGGPIEPGDLLVASSRPGVAMRAADRERAAGAVVGKAMEAFRSGQETEGLVRMMVMLR